jgi:hypothetical protein
MSKKKTPEQPIDHAVPVLRKPQRTDVQKVQTTRTTAHAMQQSPGWALAHVVQGAVATWNDCADLLEGNAAVIAQIRDQLRTAESKQRSLRRAWRAATGQLLGAVNVVCDGSADAVKDLGFDVRAYALNGALPAPEGLAAWAGKLPGEVEAGWSRGLARCGFAVQHATEPANPATYSAVIPWTKTQYTLRGAPSGATVHLRVAAIDPTSPSGIGPWSAWAAGTAR